MSWLKQNNGSVRLISDRTYIIQTTNHAELQTALAQVRVLQITKDC